MKSYGQKNRKCSYRLSVSCNSSLEYHNQVTIMSFNNFVVVNTEYGPVQGNKKTTILGRDYFNFQGIPYMKKPVGKLRFRDAQSPEKWTEPLDATKEPPSYCVIDFMTFQPVGQEDAAVINVYTPYVKPKAPLPVLFSIHGGGYQVSR